MQSEYIFAALFSAVLHAAWNAAVKAHPRPTEAMASQMMTSALLVLPGLAWTGLPASGAWPWIIASMTMNTITVVALLKSYELAGFGIAYTFGRAVSVLFVVPMAAAIAGDRVGMSALAGIGLIVASLGVLALASKREKPLSKEALLWIFVAGASSAAYIICDAQGVRQAGSPLAYGFTVSIANAIAMGVRLRHVRSPVGILRDNWRIGLPTSVAAVLSYVLILWVWSHTAIAPASALRDTSSVFAIIIATVFLKEPLTTRRIIAVLLAAIAVPLLRLG